MNDFMDNTFQHILLFFVQLLVAIDHVHKLNILHRDLKTQNVMFNRKRNILKIGDFGISKVLSSKITSAKTVVGTPCYISPEICEGKMYATKSDIWALGCILYELTTLNKAFEGPNLPALVMKIMQANSALRPLDPSYSTALKDLIYLTLQRNPDDRPNVQKILATPIIVNAHLNLSTDVGRLPCSKLDPVTNAPMTCTRMNSKGEYMQQQYLVDEYSPPGGTCDVEKSPKPIIYLWGGGVTAPMILDLPTELVDSKAEAVVCGRTQRMAVTDDGKVISWKVSAGALVTTQFTTTLKGGGRGRKRETLQLEPMLVSGLKTIKKVSCGDLFTACLTDRGILMTFGSGTNGALGHGNYKDGENPEMVQSMLEYETTEVACGAHHVIAITAEGEVFAWGEGDRGQLGLGTGTEKTPTPTKVRLPAGSKTPVSACCGSDCSIIITESGQTLASGVNKHNKLMLDCEGDAGDSQSASQTSSSAVLSDSGASSSSLFSSSGSSKSSKETGGILAIMESIKRPPDQSFIEMTMSGRREKLGVAFDDIGMEGLTDEGVKWSSGASLSRDSGLSFMKSRASQANKPKWRVNSASKFTLTGSKLVRECHITAAALGINHSALLTASGDVLTCGDNAAGQLGYPKTAPPPDRMTYFDRTPQTVLALQDLEVIKVTCGDLYCIASCKDGSLYSWGRGRGGRLGKNTEVNVSVPEKIPFELPSHKLLSMSSSHGVTLLATVPPV